MIPPLLRVTTYKSPIGGSRDPARISPDKLLFEIIREGSVYGFEKEPVLHGEGGVFCHRPWQKTVSRSPSNGYYNCLVVEFEYKKDAHIFEWPRYFQWSDRRFMHQFTDDMLYYFHYAPMSREVIGDLIWSSLRFELERFKSLVKTERLHPQLSMAIDFINANYTQPISTQDVAKAAGISSPHLYMLFRESLKESPHQYLIQKRMHAAGHSLVTTKTPIKVIAKEVGYENTENFCRAFKSFFGKSASEYRQAYAK